MGNLCSGPDGGAKLAEDADEASSELCPEAARASSEPARPSLNSASETAVAGTAAPVKEATAPATPDRLNNLEGADTSNGPELPLVVVLFDGDGLHFDEKLMKRGSEGGKQAARELCKAIRDIEEIACKRPNMFRDAPSEIQVGTSMITLPFKREHQIIERPGVEDGREWKIVIAVFQKRKWLRGAMSRAGLSEEAFDAFWIGFTEANELSSVVNVGDLKEGADSKIRAQLSLWCSIRECKRIYAGITHDGGYVSFLEPLLGRIRADKIVFLKGMNKMAYGYRDVGMRTIVVPRLFRSIPLGGPTSNTQTAIAPKPSLAGGSAIAAQVPSLTPTVTGEAMHGGVVEEHFSSVSPVTARSELAPDPTGDVLVKAARRPCYYQYLRGNCTEKSPQHRQEYLHDIVLSERGKADLRRSAKSQTCFKALKDRCRPIYGRDLYLLSREGEMRKAILCHSLQHFDV